MGTARSSSLDAIKKRMAEREHGTNWKIEVPKKRKQRSEPKKQNTTSNKEKVNK